MGAGESAGKAAGGAGKAGAASSRQWAPYLEAACGFKNHWYPALFSHELKDNDVKGVRSRATRSRFAAPRARPTRCRTAALHRGVKMSLPAALPDRRDDELLVPRLQLRPGRRRAARRSWHRPTIRLIGKVRIRTYPVEERNGMIFVFVGDEDYSRCRRSQPTCRIRMAPTKTPTPSPTFSTSRSSFAGFIAPAIPTGASRSKTAYDPGHWLVHMGNTIIASADCCFRSARSPFRTRRSRWSRKRTVRRA